MTALTRIAYWSGRNLGQKYRVRPALVVASPSVEGSKRQLTTRSNPVFGARFSTGSSFNGYARGRRLSAVSARQSRGWIELMVSKSSVTNGKSALTESE